MHTLPVVEIRGVMVYIWRMIKPLLVSLTMVTMLPVFAVAQDKPQQSAVEQSPGMDIAGLPEVWLQGEPIKSWEKDHVYVFEFWATWCGPCLAAMPHMEELHQALNSTGKVHIVGVNVSDRKSPDELKKFLANRPKKVTYAIAVDVNNARSSAIWLDTLKVQGIPFVIAVKNGKLIWKGHPVRLKEAMIREMLQPDFDAAKFNISPEEINRQERAAYISIHNGLNELLKEKGVEAVVARIGELKKENKVPKKYYLSLCTVPYVSYVKAGDYAKAQSYMASVISDAATGLADRMLAVDKLLQLHDLPGAKLNIELVKGCLEACADLAAKDKEARISILQKHARLARIAGENEAAVQYLIQAAGLTSMGGKWQTLSPTVLKGEDFTSAMLRLALSKKSPTRRTQLPVIETVEDELMSPIFKKLHWMNAAALPGLPKEGVTIVDFWRARQFGSSLKPYNYSAGRAAEIILEKYKLQDCKNIRILVLNIYGVGQDGMKKLAPTYEGTSYPVACCADDAVFKLCDKQFQLKYFPSCAVFRDGVFIWAGETQHLPTWVADEMSAENFDAEACKKRLAERNRRNHELGKIVKQAYQLRQNKNYEEQKAFLQAHIKDYPGEIWFVDQLAMLEFRKNFQLKDYKKAVDALDAVLVNYPREYGLASHYEKLFHSLPELKPFAYDAVRRALQIMRDRNTRDDAMYNVACYSTMAQWALDAKNEVQAKLDLEKAFLEHPIIEAIAEILRNLR